MLMRVSSVLAALALVALLAGCGAAPDTELKSSETALQGSEQAEAATYAADLHQSALDSLNAAKLEIQEQDSKFALFRSYGRARQLLTSATQLADQAKSVAATARDEVRLEDSTLIADVAQLISATQLSLTNAPKGKGTRADLEMLKTDLTRLETAFAGAQADYQSGNYLAAKTKLETIETQIYGIQEQIEAARDKLTSKAGTK
ncbi:MAG: hypothetical protein ABIJ61_03915 [bacterium]